MSEYVEDLLGAYALDAVSDTERRRVERALDADPVLGAEADDLLRVAGVLAADLTSDAPAPPHVWESIVAAIAAPAAPAARRFSPPAFRWFTAAAGAAAVALVAVLGIQVFLQRTEIDDLRADPLAAAAEEAATRPGAVEVAMAGDVSAGVVLGPDGVGFVHGEDLPPLEATETYQLWAIVDDRVISAGVLGADPGISPFRIDGPVAGFALTVERAGGVVSSEQDPVAVGLLEG